MDAVGTADADGVLMFQSTRPGRFQQHVKIGQQFIRRLDQLYRQAGIQNIRGRHALMDETGFGSHIFGNRSQESDDIVLDLRFDRIDTFNVEIALFTYHFDSIFRNDTKFGLFLTGQSLNLQPDAKSVFRFPNMGHFRSGVAWDHLKTP